LLMQLGMTNLPAPKTAATRTEARRHTSVDASTCVHCVTARVTARLVLLLDDRPVALPRLLQCVRGRESGEPRPEDDVRHVSSISVTPGPRRTSGRVRRSRKQGIESS